MSYPEWSEQEDNMVRTLYPDLGARGTTAALRAEHFIRTEGAVKVRAKYLNVKRDRSKIHRVQDDMWTPQELDVIRASYPTGGAEMVKKYLDALGYTRTIGAINTRANMMGVKLLKTKRRMTKGGDKVVRNICLDTELDVDVIRKLDSVSNRSQYVRDLVKADIS